MSAQFGCDQFAPLRRINFAHEIICEFDNVPHAHIRGLKIAEDILEGNIHLLERVVWHCPVFSHPYLTREDQNAFVS